MLLNICNKICAQINLRKTQIKSCNSARDLCFLLGEVTIMLKERKDGQIVLHLQYVSGLVAMQQHWESVEEGGWEDGDS